MKFDLQELKKALTKVEEYGKLAEVEIEFDPMQRLLIKYTEPMGGDRCTITLFPSNAEKMAEITITTRL